MDLPCDGCAFCNLSEINVTEITQGNSSDTENEASSSPSPGVYQVASSTCTSSAVSVQAFIADIQAAQLSLSQVQQGVSHAEQQLQQLQKQQLQQQQQQQYHNHHINTSNHHSHQKTFTQHNNCITHYHNEIPTTPKPGSHHYHIKTVQSQILEPSPKETISRKELEQFAKNFKQRRRELGFTQRDVALAMGKLYGNRLSYMMIARFETLKLSFKKMCYLKRLLQKWLEDTDSSLTNSGSQTNPMTTRRKMRRRTCLGISVIMALENAFLQNPRPSLEEIAKLAESLAMEKKVVRMWFYYRRRKEEKINPPSAAMESPTITESAPSNMFASIANPIDKN